MGEAEEASFGLHVLVEQIHLGPQAEARQLVLQELQVPGQVVAAHLRLQREHVLGRLSLVGKVGGEGGQQQEQRDGRRAQVDGHGRPGKPRVGGRQLGLDLCLH